ncbi:unnamed protein product [Brachionus calyciflorus]|uniref:Uncharacterized protein n=1 Tax=Brachionus calyciflorus TaxID=104777 RepID=A0A813N8G3_9BILA|nr:unnamed protein product [Brachionus calyciflorus]
MESVDHRSYFKEMNKFNTDSLSGQISNPTDPMYKNTPMTKGFLSEYQHSFFYPTKERNKNDSAKPKLRDTFSFVNKSLIQDSFILENLSTRPSHESSQGHLKSSYKDDFNYYGNENVGRSIDDLHKIKGPYNSLNTYNKGYIRNFEEMNSGLVDNYSMTKGGALLQLRDGLQNSSQVNFSSQSKLPMGSRNHDLRSVWIPKKFEGRNMFASHIDSMIFPEKTEKDFDTDYYKNYDASVESKKVFEKAPYDKIDKSVQYVMNYESKYVPSVQWYPSQEKFSAPHQHNKDDIFDSKSIYQADFEAPLPSKTQKTTKPISGDEIQKNLEQLNQRRNEIDIILAKN